LLVDTSNHKKVWGTEIFRRGTPKKRSRPQEEGKEGVLFNVGTISTIVFESGRGNKGKTREFCIINPGTLLASDEGDKAPFRIVGRRGGEGRGGNSSL